MLDRRSFAARYLAVGYERSRLADPVLAAPIVDSDRTGRSDSRRRSWLAIDRVRRRRPGPVWATTAFYRLEVTGGSIHNSLAINR